MAKLLTPEQISRYREAGYLSGVGVLSEEEAGRARQAALTFLETHANHPDHSDWVYYKSHLLFGWVDALVHQPRLLDAVEDLLGPDVLLWNSFLPFKAPRSSSHFGWHQDSTYWGLEPPTLGLTVWLALGAVTAESGCMRVIPGSQTRGQLPHEQTFHKDSLLRRGQRITAPVDEGRAAEVRFRFSVPLEDSSLRWMTWVGRGYEPFVIPAVGETRTLPAIDLIEALG